MAVILRLYIIPLTIYLWLFFISESECMPIKKSYYSSITNFNDSEAEGYSQYIRKALMDASHVLDNMIEKSKKKLMDLPYEGWIV